MNRIIFIAACLLIIGSSSMAGEDCRQFGGVCRDRCAPDESSVSGAFLDCSDRQECCMEKQGKNEKKPAPAQETSPEKKNEK